MKLLVSCMLFLLCTRSTSGIREPSKDADILPGWMGSDYRPAGLPEPPERARLGFKVLDWDARIFLWRNFITADEADHIRALAEPRLMASAVVDTETGSSVLGKQRTSKGTFLARGEDEVVAAIEDRIARWTLLPADNGEGLQVLRYQNGQKYDAHWDYFFHEGGEDNGGNRYATCLMYLTDVEEGGETTFPNIPAPGGENAGFSDCAKKVLAAKPRKGDAVLFHSMKTTGELEPKSLHQACPVIKGEKWSAAKWIHVGRYAQGNQMPQKLSVKINKVRDPRIPKACWDRHDKCATWAASGECKRNPVYMVGKRSAPGNCMESCKRCDIVAGIHSEASQDLK